MADVKLQLEAKKVGLSSWWYVQLTVVGIGIWSSDPFDAKDEAEALGIGVDIFARQFGNALRGDEE